jgi:hypothetical protein
MNARAEIQQILIAQKLQRWPPQDGYFFFRGEMLPFLPHTFAPLS